MAKPLAQINNIGSIILENPFYGQRKPKEQKYTDILYYSCFLTFSWVLGDRVCEMSLIYS